MKARFTFFLLLLAGTVPAMGQTTQDAPDADRAQISRSDLMRRADMVIRQGVKFLLSKQNNGGSWSPDTRWPDPDNGGTALVTLALLSCGESHQTPALAKAIQYLKRVHPETGRGATYSMALRSGVYSMLPEAMRRDQLRFDVSWLQRDIIPSGPHKGMYDYYMGGFNGGDYSNSQYGVLGVWYGAETGIEVPATYWQKVEEGWLAGQNPDGGWPYKPGFGNSYASMTAGAAATLYFVHDFLHSKDSADLSVLNIDKPLDDAMNWLANNFAVDRNIGKDEQPRRGRADDEVLNLIGNLGRESGVDTHYMLFGYERVGEASGLTRFGTHKWYDEGADFLIRTQAYDGHWEGTRGQIVSTAYALLFLSRGRAPIVAQKLQFDGRWDNRARDMAGFTRFMRRATERHVNWQVVSIDSSPEELRESPMIEVASDRDLSLTNEQKARLKTYIDQGGLLVCVNEGKSDDFSKSVIAMGQQLYPAYKFRDLLADHPAFSANFPASYSEQPMKALSNGVRELIVLYSGGDMSWKWQAATGAFSPRTTPYATLANLWLYATDRANPRFKGEDTWIDRNDAVESNRSIRIFRVNHTSNWNPEPGGWERLANIMHNFDQVELGFDGLPRAPTTTPTTTAIRPATRPTTQPLAYPDPKIDVLAHLTATRAVQLSSPMKTALKRYVDGGGMLLLDAAGGSSEASGSFDPLLKELFPGVVIAPLPLDHPIYHAASYGGQEIEHVTYRKSQDLSPVTIPRLRGAMVGTKLVAIVSYEDLSGGLVGYSTAGLVGYTPQSASDLVRNIIMWRASALR